MSKKIKNITCPYCKKEIAFVENSSFLIKIKEYKFHILILLAVLFISTIILVISLSNKNAFNEVFAVACNTKCKEENYFSRGYNINGISLTCECCFFEGREVWCEAYRVINLTTLSNGFS